MKNIKHTLIALSITTSLGACSSLHDYVTPEKNEVAKTQSETKQTLNNEGHSINNGSTSDPFNRNASFTTKYRNLLKENQLRQEQIALIEQQKTAVKKSEVQPESQDINFYVRRLMQDLVNNLQFVNSRTPVAVTDFVMLDSDLNTTNLLGHQIAESLMHEIHKFGIPVIDYKATGYIRVTPDGDFFLTRNYEEISSDLPIRYVFTGVLTKHLKGYLVNAKVVGVQSKALVGTAQSFIPEHVAETLISSQNTIIEKPNVVISLSQG